MEEETNTPKRREPRAWLCINGEKKPLEYTRTSEQLSVSGIRRRTIPPNPIPLTEDELRAIRAIP